MWDMLPAFGIPKTEYSDDQMNGQDHCIHLLIFYSAFGWLCLQVGMESRGARGWWSGGGCFNGGDVSANSYIDFFFCIPCEPPVLSIQVFSAVSSSTFSLSHLLWMLLWKHSHSTRRAHAIGQGLSKFTWNGHMLSNKTIRPLLVLAHLMNDLDLLLHIGFFKCFVHRNLWWSVGSFIKWRWLAYIFDYVQ